MKERKSREGLFPQPRPVTARARYSYNSALNALAVINGAGARVECAKSTGALVHGELGQKPPEREGEREREGDTYSSGFYSRCTMAFRPLRLCASHALHWWERKVDIEDERRLIIEPRRLAECKAIVDLCFVPSFFCAHVCAFFGLFHFSCSLQSALSIVWWKSARVCIVLCVLFLNNFSIATSDLPVYDFGKRE